MGSGLQSLLWFGLIAGFFFLIMRGGCGSHVMGHGHGHHGDDLQPPAPGGGQPGVQTGKAIDPA